MDKRIEKRVEKIFVFVLVVAVMVGMIMGIILIVRSYTTREATVEELKAQVAVLNQQIQKMETKLQALPSITVISPNGGEEWVGEKSYKIAWTQSGLEEKKVDILLAGYDKDGNQIDGWYVIETEIPASQGYFYWVPYGVPSFFLYFSTTPEKYQIKVQQVEEPVLGTVSDSSDDYFSIKD